MKNNIYKEISVPVKVLDAVITLGVAILAVLVVTQL